ncbi:MAG: hypothetical protein MAG431_00664 [Chloroflexi bacterium]|nr:hypothetical protein [Chloroflexota bacterium]
MIKQLSLFIRLMKDDRIHPLIKLLPILSLIYLIIFPDFFPGPINDAGIIALAMGIFIALVPQEILDEYKEAQKVQDEIIEGDFEDL